MKNSSDTIGNRTRDLPACSAVPQPTAPPRAPRSHVHTFKAETSNRADTVTVIAVQYVQAGLPDERCATVVQLYTCTQLCTLSYHLG